MVEYCCGLLVNVATWACDAIPADGEIPHLQGNILKISRPGIVSGFWEFLHATHHAWKKRSWAQMLTSSRLREVLDADKDPILSREGYCCISALYRKHAKINKQATSGT